MKPHEEQYAKAQELFDKQWGTHVFSADYISLHEQHKKTYQSLLAEYNKQGNRIAELESEINHLQSIEDIGSMVNQPKD